MIYFISITLITIIVVLYLIFFLLPLFNGAPYVGSNQEIIRKMVEISNLKKGDKVADLGSGDGRVIIAFAKEGVESHGYEINPLLVLLSKIKIKKEGLENKAFAHLKSFWRVDFSKFDVVTVFGGFHIMKNLEKKLWKELSEKGRVVSSTFLFPNWKYARKGGGVYLYKYPRTSLA